MPEQHSVDIAQGPGAGHCEVAVPAVGDADRGQCQRPFGRALRDRRRSVGIASGGRDRANLGDQRLLVCRMHRGDPISDKRHRSFCGRGQFAHDGRDATAQCNAGDACLYFCRAEYRFVFLLAQTGHHRARDCRERGRERHFQQGESATAGGGNQVCGHTLVGKAGPETQSRYFCGGQTVDVLAVVGGVRAHQCQPGGEHQLAPGKPRCGVRQLCGLRERDGVGGSCSVGEQSQREVFLAQEPRDRNRHLIKASCRCRYGVALELRVSISAVLAMLRASHTRMQYTTERVVT